LLTLTQKEQQHAATDTPPFIHPVVNRPRNITVKPVAPCPVNLRRSSFQYLFPLFPTALIPITFQLPETSFRTSSGGPLLNTKPK